MHKDSFTSRFARNILPSREETLKRRIEKVNDTDRYCGINDKCMELSTHYWLKRLEHTLTHTQTSSRLIYIVDGAALALIYFYMKPRR